MLMLIIDFRVRSSAPVSADLDDGSRLFYVFITILMGQIRLDRERERERQMKMNIQIDLLILK